MANYYLKPEDFKKDYLESKKLEKCTDKLISDFRLIADNVYLTITKGVHHDDEESCKSYAVSEAWRKWDKFDPKKSTNIFAFFTQMIKNDIMIHYNYLNGVRKDANGIIRKQMISMTLFEEGNDTED